MDNIGGYLMVGANERGEIVVNHPDLKPDEHGVGHIVFSPAQARSFAGLLVKHAESIDLAASWSAEAARRKAAEAVPVNRDARILTDGTPVSEDHREIDPLTGQQRGYVVLTSAERAKGFVRPVRRSYTHKTCGSVTTMGLAIAETYARDPKFYNGTFCCTCRTHRPLNEFVWEGTSEQVGS